MAKTKRSNPADLPRSNNDHRNSTEFDSEGFVEIDLGDGAPKIASTEAKTKDLEELSLTNQFHALNDSDRENTVKEWLKACEVCDLFNYSAEEIEKKMKKCLESQDLSSLKMIQKELKNQRQKELEQTNKEESWGKKYENIEKAISSQEKVVKQDHRFASLKSAIFFMKKDFKQKSKKSKEKVVKKIKSVKDKISETVGSKNKRK